MLLYCTYISPVTCQRKQLPSVGHVCLQAHHPGKAAADLEDQKKIEQQLYPLIWALMKTEPFPSTFNVKHAILTYADCTEEAFRQKYAPDSTGQPPLMTRLLSKVRLESTFVMPRDSCELTSPADTTQFWAHCCLVCSTHITNTKFLIPPCLTCLRSQRIVA